MTTELSLHGGVVARPGNVTFQIDLPGVNSEFIEGHRALLASLLDQLASEPATPTGARGFAKRHGLLESPLQVRLRTLRNLSTSMRHR